MVLAVALCAEGNAAWKTLGNMRKVYSIECLHLHGTLHHHPVNPLANIIERQEVWQMATFYSAVLPIPAPDRAVFSGTRCCRGGNNGRS